MKKYLFPFLMVLALTAAVMADVIHMKDGSSREGQVVGRTDDAVTLRVLAGTREAEISIPMCDVDRIEEKPSTVAMYHEKRAGVKGDAAAQKKLAAWCRDNALAELADMHEKEARSLLKAEFIKKHPESACDKCGASGLLPCEKCERTGFVKAPCPKCKGVGEIECSRCKGRGLVTCKKCKGAGVITKKVKEGRKTVTKTVACPECNGQGMVTCPMCEGKGVITCPTCRGKKFVKKKCPDCKGKKDLPCDKCGGTGILPGFREEFEKAFQALGAPEKEKPPVKENPQANESPEKPGPAPSEPEKEQKVWTNIYELDADGNPTDNITALNVTLYLKRPFGEGGKVAYLQDNTPLTVLAREKDVLKVRTTGGTTGWIYRKYVRNEKYEYETCKACEGRGFFKCPACEGSGRITIDGKAYSCKVCGGRGKIKCRHCHGLGKRRKR